MRREERQTFYIRAPRFVLHRRELIHNQRQLQRPIAPGDLEGLNGKGSSVGHPKLDDWRQDDFEFASLWDEAHENALDRVESVLYQKAVSGVTIAMIFYLKAHRPIYRDRLNIDIKQVQGEIEEKIAQLLLTSHLVSTRPSLILPSSLDQRITSLLAILVHQAQVHRRIKRLRLIRRSTGANATG